MTNREQAQKLRDANAQKDKDHTQEALASKGTKTKESEEITKLQDKLDNANSIIKDKDTLLAEKEEAIESYKKEIETLNAMLSKKK